VVNSKGRRRRPGTKNLAQVLRTDDHLFVDFIAKCLVWDPERRMKPLAALRHEFITSGRRPRITSPSPSISKPLSLSSSSKQKGGETPKKSQISAPTPLTARSSRNAVPTTPSTLSSLTLSTSRSHRTSQQQSYSGYYSARTINSLPVCDFLLFCCFNSSRHCRVLLKLLDTLHHFNDRSITFHVHTRITIMLSNDK
jgi:dual specificity tyrosine-phosphorylation-regulated kinase 2/3/4